MNKEQRISDEILGAFVDGQLGPAEWAAVAQALEDDGHLREEACRLRMVKELVRHAYPMPAPAARRPRPFLGAGWLAMAASSLLFAVAGWFAHGMVNRPPALDPTSAYALSGNWHSLRSDWGSLQEGKVLVHVSGSGRDSLSATLDEVEDLLRDARLGNRRLEVAIVANGPGLDLFRADDRDLAGRLGALRREYPGLAFVACAQTVERRRAAGHAVELVEGATIATSALHEVVERLRAGWIYVRA